MRFKKLITRRIILLLIFIIGLFGYITYDEMINESFSRQKLSEVEREFHQIQPMTDAVPTSDLQSTTRKAKHVTVGNLYRTNLTYSEIRAYYDAELAKHGWKFQKELKVNGPDGKDYGGKQVFYYKGEFTAFIYHVGEKPNPEYTYYFRVSWDS